jgi:hypothetical protein
MINETLHTQKKRKEKKILSNTCTNCTKIGCQPVAYLECATPWAAPEFVALQKNKYNTHTHIYICLFDGVYRHFQQYFCYIVAISFAWWRKTEDPEKTIDLPQVTDKLYHIMLYTSPWSRFELTTSVVIGTDCIGNCKSNYHTIMAATSPI